MAENNECPNPDCTNRDVGEEDGQIVCRGCGTVVNDSNIVAEVTFGALANGGHVLHGAHVGADQAFATSGGLPGHMGSREQTEEAGKRYVEQLGAALTMSQTLIDTGMQIFKLASANNFIQGRRTRAVAAVCLYVGCRVRKEENRIMLIDLSDVLMLNVFKLGHIYKDLIDAIQINGNGFTVHPINPEDLILRFAKRLEFGDDTMRVAGEAVRIVQRMDRDWMTPGRRPAGICGAALILAARMNNYRRSIREMVYIVKVTESTISKRLEEFKVTESSGLTVEEFRTIDLERTCDPPSFYTQKEGKKRGRKRKLIEIEDDDSSGTESRRSASATPSTGAKRQETAAAKRRQAQADSQSMPPPPIPIDPNLLQVPAQRLSELQQPTATEDGSSTTEDGSSTTDDSSSTTKGPSAKRKRGPKEAVETIEPPPAKRKRGPNKAGSSTETTESPPPAKRKRGRPRKNQSPNPTGHDPSPEPTGHDPSPEPTGHDPSPEKDITSLLSAPSNFASATALHRALSSPTTENPDADPSLESPDEPTSSGHTDPPRIISSDPEISDSEFASDEEVINCLLTPSERAIKERIWTHENADFLRTQQAKLLKQQMAEADGTARTIVKRTRRRGRMGDMSAYRDGDEGEDGAVARTPAEAALKMLKRRGYSKKINYDSIKALYALTPKTASTDNTNENTNANTNANTPSDSPATGSNSRRPSDTSAPSVSPSVSRSQSPAPSASLAVKITPPNGTTSSTTQPAVPAVPGSVNINSPDNKNDEENDDAHEAGDPDFWDEGELEQIQGKIENRLGREDDEEEDDMEVEEEEVFDRFDVGSDGDDYD